MTSLIDGLLQTAGGSGDNNLEELLFSDKPSLLEMTTEVQPDLVFSMALFGMVEDKFRSKNLKSFGKHFYKLQISKDRKGRIELIEALLAGKRQGDMGGDLE